MGNSPTKSAKSKKSSKGRTQDSTTASMPTSVSDKKTGGGARALGGTGPTQQGTDEEERQKRIAIIEARAKKSASMGGLSRENTNATISRQSSAITTNTPKPSSTLFVDSKEIPVNTAENTNTTVGSDGAEERSSSGGAPDVSPSREPPAVSNPMLEAALRRAQANPQPGQNTKNNNDPVRIELMGQINAILQRRGESEPFGLRSMDNAKLRVYLKHMQQK